MSAAKLAPNMPQWMVDHTNRYLASGGTDGHMYTIQQPDRPQLSVPSLLLTTTGRKSGEKFIFPLFYGESDGGYVIVGSPNDVVEQLREVATNLNVGNLMMLLQFGNMGKELAKYNTKMFAEHVKPKLAGLFSEWEHRWWPRPMDTAMRAEVPAYAPALAAE